MTSPGARPRIPAAAFAVVVAGVSAALHLGKLPPAVPALQASLGIGLVEAGFLLSLVQVASMTLGLLAGLAADKRGDALLAQGKRDEARAAYEQAYKAMDPQADYRNLVEVKLNALGVDVAGLAS